MLFCRIWILTVYSLYCGLKCGIVHITIPAILSNVPYSPPIPYILSIILIQNRTIKPKKINDYHQTRIECHGRFNLFVFVFGN